jgi:F-type H+-transporting ATPase subunit epsilon
MNIAILTPEKEIFRGVIKSVKVPGTLGQFQVLNNHAPIVSSLEKGKVEIVTSKGEYQYYDEESGNILTAEETGKTIVFNITGGFIEVLKNEIALLVQGIVRA